MNATRSPAHQQALSADVRVPESSPAEDQPRWADIAPSARSRDSYSLAREHHAVADCRALRSVHDVVLGRDPALDPLDMPVAIRHVDV
jgi:hypothetical protein